MELEVFYVIIDEVPLSGYCKIEYTSCHPKHFPSPGIFMVKK
jgi:hypothetical protein